MPLAVTHILIPIILLDLYRDHINKKKGILTNKHILLAGLAGIFPDIDLPIGYLILNDLNIHRLFTHSIWFPLLFLVISIALYYSKRKNMSKYFLMISFGMTIHIFLDATLGGYVCLLCPFSGYSFGFNLFDHIIGIFRPDLLETEFGYLIYSSMDAVLLFLWLLHEQLEGKIRDYF